MFSIRKAAIGAILGVSVAIAGVPNAVAATKTVSDQGTASKTEIRVLESTADSAKLKVKDGSIKENTDGTVTISNDASRDSVTLRSATLLSDGSISNIHYTVDGDEINATLSTPIVAGEKEPVVDQDWVECGLGTVGTIAVVGSIPVTGGATAALLPALGAGAAAGTSAYECVKAGKDSQ